MGIKIALVLTCLSVNAFGQDHIIIALQENYEEEILQEQRLLIVNEATETMLRQVADASVVFDDSILMWQEIHDLPGCTFEFQQSVTYIILAIRNTELWKLEIKLAQLVDAFLAKLEGVTHLTSKDVESLVADCELIGELADNLRDKSLDFSEDVEVLSDVLR